MVKPKNSPLKLSPLERRLAGPPPRPTPVWEFSVIVAERFPQPGRGRRFSYRGLDLTYDGPAWFSQVHHAYRIRLRGGRNRRARIDPVGMVIELAEQLAVRADCVSCRLAAMNWPNASPGLCTFCWESGRRIAGRAYLHAFGHRDGPSLVRTIHLCEFHRQDYTFGDLTEVP